MGQTYYDRKVLAYREIDKLFEQGKTDDEIILEIQYGFGFGEYTVMARLHRLRAQKKGASHGKGRATIHA